MSNVAPNWNACSVQKLAGSLPRITLMAIAVVATLVAIGLNLAVAVVAWVAAGRAPFVANSNGCVAPGSAPATDRPPRQHEGDGGDEEERPTSSDSTSAADTGPLGPPV